MITPRTLWIRGRQGSSSAWLVLGIRILAATVWFVFGAVFKILGAVPRHREIVAQILGNDRSSSITALIGLGETAIGLWMLIGAFPRSCAVVQTVAIIAMNALELTYARSFLLAPVPMVIVNAIFLALVWYSALWSSAKQS